MFHKYNAKKIFYWIFLALWAGLIAWATIFTFDWIGTFSEGQQLPAYRDLSDELKLKSPPKDVLYSEAYRTASGTDEVRYAYMAGEVPVAEREDIGRRTPNSQTEVMEVKQEGEKMTETLKATFYSKPQFYQDGGNWRQIEYATTTAEVFSMSGAIPHIKRRELVEHFLPGSPLFAATATYYPNANTETTSVDGYVYAGWGGDTADDSSTSLGVEILHDGSGDLCPPWGCYEYYDGETRTFLLFDTSSIADNAVISSGSVSVYVLSKSSATCSSVGIATSSPGSNTALAASDFSNVGSTLLATDLSMSGLTTSAYNSFNLNSTGISNISLNGISKFALLCTNASGWGSGGMSASSADTSGTSQDPKLTVTYTADSFSFGQWFPF